MNRFVKLSYGVMLTSALCLGGCSADIFDQNSTASRGDDIGPPPQVVDMAAIDPLEAHLKSRKLVDPQKMNQDNEYIKHAEDYKPVKDKQQRIVKLERNVEEIEKDLDTVLAEAQQARETQVAPQRRLPKINPEPLRVPEYVASINESNAGLNRVAPAAGGATVRAEASVSNVRFGNHPGKTRIVLDLSAPSDYAADLQKNNREIVVSMPAVAWNAQAEKSLAADPMVASYIASSHGAGTRVVIALKKPGKLVLNTAMKPNHVHGDRVVLDVAAL